MNRSIVRIGAILLFLFGTSSFTFSQEKMEEKKDEKKEAKPEKTIASMVKKSEKIPGLFTLYRDSTTGSAHMLLTADQLDKEYIHFTYIENGILEVGRFKGAYGGNKIFKFRKYYDKIEIIQENTNYYFDPNNALSKAANANINTPVLASMKIKAESKEKDSILLAVDGVFLSEALQQIKFVSPPGTGGPRNPYRIGNFNKERTKYVAINNYPANTDIIVDYVFTNNYPTNFGMGTATDARSTTIRMQHSLIEVPENDFEPLFEDPRVGFFTHEVTDQTSKSATPYRDLVNRWHLKKKNPEAELSEPVEPIVWWIENTTPKAYRAAIKQGVENWNIAFEQAGFKNAIVVKQQPDDADWDAGDIRYNVLRWTSSPLPPFGGYGPSFVNPRTGQILGADVMLEEIFMTNRVRSDELFTEGASLEELMFHEDHQDHAAFDPHHCVAGEFLQHQMLMGKIAGDVMELPTVEMERLVEEGLMWLLLHEVGHTLGLNHNMKSSNLWSPEEINNMEVTAKEGMIGSVMDYPAINYSNDPEKQGNFSSIVPGPYDRWAIQFAYGDFDSEEEREELLAQSSKPELMFGNDADDMRAPGRGIDPRVMIGDMSSDGVGYAVERIQLVNEVLPKLKDKYAEEGNTYQEVRNGYNILMGTYSTMLRVISRYIGGVYVDRSVVGQEGATKPLLPVSESRQKEAMRALSTYAFAPNAYQAPTDLYNYLQVQRRGFNNFGRNEDPRLHSVPLSGQRGVLAHLLHPQVLRRITNTQLYGNTYSAAEVLSDLTDAIFSADMNSNVNTVRQNLQLTYVDGLLTIVSGKSSHDKIAQSAALSELLDIYKDTRKNKSGDLSSQAHKKHISFKIEQTLDLD